MTETIARVDMEEQDQVKANNKVYRFKIWDILQ